MNDAQTLTEFEVIRRYFLGVGDAATDVVALGIGDDCALLNIPSGQQLALSIDTLLAGRHFPEDANPADIGQRALAVAISDLAAMGAKPLAFTLALSLPDVDERWLEAFSYGLAAAAKHYHIPLIGGDTTRGPLSITIQVHGAVPDGLAMLRSKAKAGDRIFVTGSLGDAAAALAVIEKRLNVDAEQQQYLLNRFYRPSARVQLGQTLGAIVHAAIDVSDGLMADLGHVIRASSVADEVLSAELYVEALPLSSVLSTVVEKPQAQRYALSGGDDYELCMTVAPANKQLLIDTCQQFGVPVTEIGRVLVSESSCVYCLGSQGAVLDISQHGYQHF
ncbi:thiamine-phosphate kinase [Oceanicoccus sp. KOV_DT_Chl]|uniref:thiamine-phosphate kinase n=1 Tax=Oceanicoccus sp. KOV_DT_Chl TaxID=1904639 RepID=UPI000C7AEB10|nr:thiamine-phosphate kinase [Oceanicoccus sp. KOV_DT_Chl]